MAETQDRLTEEGRGPDQLQEGEGQKKRPFYRRPKVLIIGAVAIALGLIFGLRYYLHARSHESTDNAFIEGAIIQISPKVAGHVFKLNITDNQLVKEGELLIELDPRDFEERLRQARAELQAAEARHNAAQANVKLTGATSLGNVQQATSGLTAARSGVETARTQVVAARERVRQAHAAIITAQANARQEHAQIAAAEAEANRASADLKRYEQLYSRDEVSRQQLDQARATARTAVAQLAAARQREAAARAQVSEARAAAATAEAGVRQAETQVAQAQAQVGEARGRLTQASAAPQQVAVSMAQAGTASADIDQARAAVARAELQLSYTKIYAPVTGRITRRAVEAGNYVEVGQALTAIVTNDLWVTANFKETQIDKIRPGQPVKIKVDAFPRKVFDGWVDSIQRGSGARFSLLPPENATGNYVKVVQRVPVKIVFNRTPDPDYPLGPGMSVVPEVAVE